MELFNILYSIPRTHYYTAIDGIWKIFIKLYKIKDRPKLIYIPKWKMEFVPDAERISIPKGFTAARNHREDAVEGYYDPNVQHYIFEPFAVLFVLVSDGFSQLPDDSTDFQIVFDLVHFSRHSELFKKLYKWCKQFLNHLKNNGSKGDSS